MTDERPCVYCVAYVPNPDPEEAVWLPEVPAEEVVPYIHPECEEAVTRYVTEHENDPK